MTSETYRKFKRSSDKLFNFFIDHVRDWIVHVNVLTNASFQQPPLPITQCHMDPNMPVQYQHVQTYQFPLPGLYQGAGVGHSVITREVNYANEGINVIRQPNATVTDNKQQYVNTEPITRDHTIHNFMNTAVAKAELDLQLKTVSYTAALEPLRVHQEYSQVFDEGVKNNP